MSLGPTELLFVIINLILIIAFPVILIVAAVSLIRRIRHPEARVAKLEEASDRGESPGRRP